MVLHLPLSHTKFDLKIEWIMERYIQSKKETLVVELWEKKKNTDEFIKEIDGWKPVVYPFILVLGVV